MMKKKETKTHSKFLKFNGNVIIVASVNEVNYVPLKPILDAINMDADRAIKNVKKDPILGPVRSKQTVQLSENSDLQARNVTCLPEKYIYGWIFSLRSENDDLTDYKRTCYDLLYDHFHGFIGNRKDLLIERVDVQTKIHHLKARLKEKDASYKLLKELESKKKMLSTKLNSMDREIVKENEFEFTPVGGNLIELPPNGGSSIHK